MTRLAPSYQLSPFLWGFFIMAEGAGSENSKSPIPKQFELFKKE